MKKLTLIILTLFALLITSTTVSAFGIPSRPENGFYDPNNYISTETKNKLVEFNEKHQSTDHTQLGIAIVDTLDGENIEEVANKIATSWQIGYENSDRGALLLIAINDHKFRIETSNELRKVITDNEASDILNNARSEMRNQNYNVAVQLIMNGIEKELIKDPTDTKTNESIIPALLILFVPIVGMLIMVLKTAYDEVFKRSSGTNTDYNDTDNNIVTNPNNSSSSSWSGGGFDGGGATGGW